MEAVILNRIHDLLVYRRWFRVNRWAEWTPLRHEYETELRALVRLARQARRTAGIERAEFIDHPPNATWTAVS